MITGTSLRSRSLRQTSSPDPSGRPMSSSTRSGSSRGASGERVGRRARHAGLKPSRSSASASGCAIAVLVLDQQDVAVGFVSSTALMLEALERRRGGSRRLAAHPLPSGFVLTELRAQSSSEPPLCPLPDPPEPDSLESEPLCPEPLCRSPSCRRRRRRGSCRGRSCPRASCRDRSCPRGRRRRRRGRGRVRGRSSAEPGPELSSRVAAAPCSAGRWRARPRRRGR